jgi:hypothetical protein
MKNVAQSILLCGAGQNSLHKGDLRRRPLGRGRRRLGELRADLRALRDPRRQGGAARRAGERPSDDGDRRLGGEPETAAASPLPDRWHGGDTGAAGAATVAGRRSGMASMRRARRWPPARHGAADQRRAARRSRGPAAGPDRRRNRHRSRSGARAAAGLVRRAVRWRGGRRGPGSRPERSWAEPPPPPSRTGGGLCRDGSNAGTAAGAGRRGRRGRACAAR